MSTREFDDIIKQKAQRRKADVPPDIWENIAGKKKKRRKPFAWLIFLVLLTCGSAAVWKMNHNNNVPEPANRSNTHKKINNSKAKEIPVADNENNDNQPTIPGKVTAGNTRKAMISTKTAPLIDAKASTNTAATGNKASITVSKRYNLANTDNDERNEKTFLQHKRKRTIKGKYTTTINNSNINEPAENNMDEAIGTHPALPQKNNSNQNNSNELSPANDLSPADSNTMAALLQPAADSLNIKNILQPGISSTEKNEVADRPKKIKKKEKNKGLKIEAAITRVFPMQQYDKPLYVQRTLTTTNTRSTFTSDNNIQTSIEGGAGLAFSLVKKISNKWSLGTGISYLQFTERLQLPGSETHTIFTIVQRLKEGVNGPFLTPDTVNISTTYNSTLSGRNIYHNAGIPLFTRFRFIAGRLSLEFTTGFTANLVRKYKNNIPGQFTIVKADRTKQSDQKNSIGLDVFAGLYLSGRLYRKYDWFTSAAFSYNLSSYRTSSLSLNKKIQLPGLSFGVSYALRK